MNLVRWMNRVLDVVVRIIAKALATISQEQLLVLLIVVMIKEIKLGESICDHTAYSIS